MFENVKMVCNDDVVSLSYHVVIIDKNVKQIIFLYYFFLIVPFVSTRKKAEINKIKKFKKY